jgi:hypothetical protein
MALVLFAFATLRTLSRGQEQMNASDVAFNSGQLELSLRHARRAATLYVPGAAHVDAAYLRLEAIARGAERERKQRLALSAWRAMRAAAFESRHLWLPRASELSSASSNLERLMAAGPGVPGADAGRRASTGPWVLLLGVGFAAAIAAVAWGISRGITPRGGIVASRLTWPALLLVLGIACLGLAVVRA